MSKINDRIQNMAYEDMVAALKKYCFVRKAGNPGPACSESRQDRKPTVVIPKFSVSQRIFADFLHRIYGIDLHYSAELVYDLPPLRLVTCRAREVINFVEQGADVGLVGEDLCLEYGYRGGILLDTGLIPNNTVLVTRKDAPELPTESLRICSQYPALAKKLLGCGNVDEISGSAEAYLTLGIYDASVDTCQTGKTAAQNGLAVQKVLKTTSLVMIGSEKIKETPFYASFINYLTEL